MIKRLVDRVKGNEREEKESEPVEDYSLDPSEFKENSNVSIGDIPPGERAALLIRSFPTTVSQFKKKKDENPIELYFLVLSMITTGAMIGSIMMAPLYITLIITGVYAATVVPVLYLYEETDIFKPTKQNQS